MPQIDNTNIGCKIKLRLKHIPDRPIKVLDCFCGNRTIWRQVISESGRSDITITGIDQKRVKGCLRGNNLKFLQILPLTDFDIIDLDSYGVPFDQLDIIFRRGYRGICFFTFGQGMGGLSAIPRALVNEAGITDEMYNAIPSLYSSMGWDFFCSWLAANRVKKISYYLTHGSIGTSNMYYGFFLFDISSCIVYNYIRERGVHMSLIYEPKGKAREYSPLALNVYNDGCDHGCDYCYCKNIRYGKWSTNPKPRDLAGLDREARKADSQILLCFMGDPYCLAERTHRKTREALGTLKSNRCSVAILTKGGTRCLDDLKLFLDWPEGRIKIGATLTFNSSAKSSIHEPGAASPEDRIEALNVLHAHNVKTWVSIEPVLEPLESLAILEKSLPYVDGYKVGKLNHVNNQTDWKQFLRDSVAIIRKAKRSLYVKNDLRPYADPGFLTEPESNSETMFLPNRPNTRKDLFAV